MEAGSDLTKSASLPRIGRAVGLFFVLNAIWEMAQLPFYTLWQEGSWSEIAFAVAHCTLGDLLIGIVTALLATGFVRLSGRPALPLSGKVLIVFLPLALVYTIFSEWLNVHIRESWSYSALMPLVPPFETGLTPLLQWIILPILTWFLAGELARSR